jgi:hypothetical protein
MKHPAAPVKFRGKQTPTPHGAGVGLKKTATERVTEAQLKCSAPSSWLLSSPEGHGSSHNIWAQGLTYRLDNVDPRHRHN